jgi:hypothetical protein
MNWQCGCTTDASPTGDFGRPKCPQCGSVLLMAEQTQFKLSEFNLKGSIRHAWSCDGCAHEFVTSITVYPH